MLKNSVYKYIRIFLDFYIICNIKKISSISQRPLLMEEIKFRVVDRGLNKCNITLSMLYNFIVEIAKEK